MSDARNLASIDTVMYMMSSLRIAKLSERVLWDNNSGNEKGYWSKEEYRIACEADVRCVQWMFSEEEKTNKCLYGEAFSVGQEIEVLMMRKKQWKTGPPGGSSGRWIYLLQTSVRVRS